jgi:hypothetical protein
MARQRARSCTSALAAAALAAAVVVGATGAAADKHLEVGLALTPTIFHDQGYEAFSASDLAVTRFGADLRFEVATVAGHVRLVPLIAYRYSFDEGSPYDTLETRIKTNDFLAGLRLRGWIGDWFGVFLEGHAGLVWARVRGDVDVGYDSYDYVGARERYTDEALTWSAGGLAGIEFRLSPAMLTRRGVERFNFGAELGVGYIGRGDLEIEPTLEGGDEHSLPVAQTADWGTLDLSGWMIQIGVTFSFL